MSPGVPFPEVQSSDRDEGLSENLDKDQNQDREKQCARTKEYDFAHQIGLQ
jgi:hypothetical protein